MPLFTTIGAGTGKFLYASYLTFRRHCTVLKVFTVYVCTYVIDALILDEMSSTIKAK